MYVIIDDDSPVVHVFPSGEAHLDFQFPQHFTAQIWPAKMGVDAVRGLYMDRKVVIHQ